MEEDNNRPKSWLRHVVWLDELPNSIRAREEAAEPHHHEPPVFIEKLPSIQPINHKRHLIWVVSFFGALLIGWLLCSIFAVRTQVGLASISSNSNSAKLTKTITDQAAAYRLTIKYPDGKQKSYKLNQLGITIDTQASLKATKAKQNNLMNRLQWWQPVDAAVVFKQNKTALEGFIASETNVTVQPSQDAALSIVNGQIQLSDAVAGKSYGLNKPEQTILSASSSLKPQTIKLQTIKLEPALTAKILAPYKDNLEKTINQKVSFQVAGRTIMATPNDIAGWLEITPDDKSKKVDITVNSGKVLAYINSISAVYVHPPRAQVEFDQDDGSRQVLVAGVNGVDVVNKSSVASGVANNLLSAKGMSLPLNVSYASFQTITAGNYDKWIEVDLTNKRMYAYEKSNLVKTELVTAGAPSTPTVTGQYSIYAKFAQQDMRGQNVDGSNYFQPHVRWINYFYRDYAIHGNYWRPLSYFGNINSSHGCVSLVDSEAQWVYDWAPIGTPVIVHT